MSLPKPFWFGYKYTSTSKGKGLGIANGEKWYLKPTEQWISFDEDSLLYISSSKYFDYEDQQAQIGKPFTKAVLYEGDFEIVAGEFKGGIVKSVTTMGAGGESQGYPFSNLSSWKYFLNDYEIGQELLSSKIYSSTDPNIVYDKANYNISPGSTANVFDLKWSEYYYKSSSGKVELKSRKAKSTKLIAKDDVIANLPA